jgi:hypothetical protein
LGAAGLGAATTCATTPWADLIRLVFTAMTRLMGSVGGSSRALRNLTPS